MGSLNSHTASPRAIVAPAAGFAFGLVLALFLATGTSAADVKRALTALAPLPPGSELTFTPIALPDQPAPDPEQAAREARQRAEALENDLKTIGPITDLPPVGSGAFMELRAQALAIIERRFKESRAALEPDTIAIYASNVKWTPDFRSAPRMISSTDRDRARASSYAVAHMVTHLDRPRFILAFASAIFALDPDSALGAENAASAILASGERLHPSPDDAASLAPFRDDAVVVYRYALARSVNAGKWSMRSLSVLINLGNLYVDMKAPALARPLLLSARAYAPDSWDAALALASCYEMQGRAPLARAALEDRRIARTSIGSAASKGTKNLDETREASDLSPDSPDEDFEPVLKKLDAPQILTAGDFIDELDQSERNRMRYFVEHLPVQGSYRAPGLEGLTQFSTVQSINRPAGIQALGDFAERLGSYSLVLFRGMVNQQMEVLGRLGLGVKLNVDLNDVLTNPEKYRDRKIEATVTGAEQLKGRVEEMKRAAEQMRGQLQAGKIDSLLQTAAASDPMVALYRLKPYDFANPMDVMIQQYNASLLGRKMNTYNAYFFAVNGRTRRALSEIAELHAKKFEAIQQQESAAMEAFQKLRAAAGASGQNTNTPEWRLREHNIHRTYLPQYNAQADYAWKQATQVAANAYSDKIKPRAERFYYDVVRHIALISDPQVREKKNREFEQMLHFGVYQALSHVLGAFASCDYVEEWDCHCDVGSLLADAEREDKEIDRIQEERRAREQEAKLRFTTGQIPESTPLFQKLDAYGTDLNIPFIPFLSGRVSCARTNLALSAELPTALSPKIDYTFTQSGLTGATTHGGGIEIGVKTEGGPAEISATLNVRGSVALDGKGVVSDYSVTAASKVNVEVGPATIYAGGEVGYSRSGGPNTDVTGGAKASFSHTYGTSGEVSLEASARRGSTFSAKVEQNFNPYSGKVDEAVNEVFGQVAPVDTSKTKELWSGNFTL